MRFAQSALEAIAGALGDTDAGLTGAEIGSLLKVCRMEDPAPTITKRKRLHDAFVASQNSRGDRKAVLEFIRQAMKPERYIRDSKRFEPMRANLNRALSFVGLAVDAAGSLESAEQARTLSDAERRADELKEGLTTRGVHEDVLQFCRAELVQDDYFHAVLEATKSIAAKLRDMTGLTEDGGALVDQALSGPVPKLGIQRGSAPDRRVAVRTPLWRPVLANPTSCRCWYGRPQGSPLQPRRRRRPKTWLNRKDGRFSRTLERPMPQA